MIENTRQVRTNDGTTHRDGGMRAGSLASHDQLLRVKSLRLDQQLYLAHGPLRPHLLLHLTPRVLPNRLDQHAERRRNGTMIRDVRLVPSIVQLLDTRRIARAPEHAVAPRRDPSLLGRVVLCAVRIILVRRRKGDGALHEGAQAHVRLHFFRELIVRQQAVECVLLDGGHDHVSALVDSVVKIPAHLCVELSRDA